MLITTLRTILGGFFMGTADLVPGVSGGTIALVIGIYERLVESIREASSALGTALRGDFAASRGHLGRVEWGFVIPLLGGILLAVALLATFIERQLAQRPTVVAAAFLGLVLGSVVIAWGLLHDRRAEHLVTALIVAVAAFLLLGFGEGQVSGQPALLVFFGSGALAITAMILPGISGSLILLMVGMYGPVLGAVTQRDLISVGVFTLGAVAGLALFSQLLHWALQHHHDRVVAALVGLMAGSARVLWPWPAGVASSDLAAPADDWPAAVVAAVIGTAAVFVISRVAAVKGANAPPPS